MRKKRRKAYRLRRYNPIGYETKATGLERRRRRRRMFVEALATLGCIAVVALVLTLGTSGVFSWYLHTLRLELGGGDLEIRLEGDRMSLVWPEAEGLEDCQVFRYDPAAGDYAYCGQFDDTELVLEGVAAGEELGLKFQAVRSVSLLGREFELKGFERQVTVVPVELDAPMLVKGTDSEGNVMMVSWATDARDKYEVYMMDHNGEWKLLSITDRGQVELNFTDQINDADWDGSVRLAVRVRRQEEDYVLYSGMSETAEIDQSYLVYQNSELGLVWEKTGECQYRFGWKRTGGAYYEVQQWSERTQAWETRQVYDSAAESMQYETGRLASSTEMRFRVIAYDSEAQRDAGEFVTEPAEVHFRTDLSTLYCTVWPIIPLSLTAESDGSGGALAQIPEGTALCVLGEENGRFQVRYRGTYGYVDSDYCMINLPEYLGDLCDYSIENSYQSIFRVHGYDIPRITNGVVQGYEGIYLGNHDYLVPYLYPCSAKLLQAAENVRKDGYCLHIYDAFRPNEASRCLYSTMEGLMNYPVPEKTERIAVPAGEDGRELSAGQDAEGGEAQEGAGSEENPGDGGNPANQGTYGGLTPEVLGMLKNMTPMELQMRSLTQATAVALRSLSVDSMLTLRGMSSEEFSVFRSLSLDALLATGLFYGEDSRIAVSDGGTGQEASEAGPAGQFYTAVGTDPAAGQTVPGTDPATGQPLPGTDPAAAGQAVPGVDPATGQPLPGTDPAAGQTAPATAPASAPTAEMLRKFARFSRDELLMLKSLSAEELTYGKLYLQENMQTYGDVMLNENFRLGSFLAATVSAHNRGIAVDLTLERLDNGQDLTMQTEMHDLSWYASLSQNNGNANLLAEYMKGVGFNDLISEWWHFQDDETREAIGLDSYMTEGVEITGWKKDDNGWKYRLEDGSYYTDTTVTVEGQECTFDSDGYCMQ